MADLPFERSLMAPVLMFVRSCFHLEPFAPAGVRWRCGFETHSEVAGDAKHMLRLISVGLALLGASLIWAAAIQLRTALKSIGPAYLQENWKLLIGLVQLITASYFVVIILNITGGRADDHVEEEIIAATAMFLVGIFVICLVRLSSNIIKEVKYLRPFEDLSNRDPLTGAFNRRYLNSVLQIAVGEDWWHQGGFSLLAMDIDGFKTINDTYGHQAGDEVLRHVFRLANTLCRSTDTVVRYGGDEMIIILPRASLEEALTLAERIRASISRSSLTLQDGKEISVATSIGVASLQSRDDHHALIGRADRALYAAKRSGRNRVFQQELVGQV